MLKPEFARDFFGPFRITEQNDLGRGRKLFPTADCVSLNDADMAVKWFRRCE
jgi:hypothetical protein